jgi:superfamily II DNA or RNA helicase
MADIIIDRYNSVYSRVTSNDMGILQELSEFFEFFVPGYQHMPLYKNKVWDGKIRLYNTYKQLLYSGIVYHIEHFAKSRNYTIEYRYENGNTNFSLVDAQDFIKQQNFTLTPHSYQLEAFIYCIRNHRALLESPTASGKSFLIYMLMRYYLKPTLIIVPTTTLVHQIYSDFQDYGFKSDKYCHKVFSGQDKDTDKPIVITTWQSVYKLPKSWFNKFDVVFGDEAHTFQAKSLTGIMEKLETCEHRFGLTGSLNESKTHKLVLEGLFGPHKKVITTKELMDTDVVSKLKIKIIVLNYPTDVIKSRKILKDKKAEYKNEIDFLVSNQQRNKFLKNLALSLDGNTMLLYQYVEKHGKVLYNMIKEDAGDRKVFFIHGNVDGKVRDDIRGIVEEESNAIIVASYQTMSTGINIKSLDNVIFGIPVKSKIRSLQSIGRSLRKSKNSEYATLYDVADSMKVGSKMNYSLRHLHDRIEIYDNEKFEYKIYTVALK